MAARVLVTRDLPDGGMDPLRAAGLEVVRRATDDPYTPAELVDLAPQFDAMVCLLSDRIDSSTLEAGAGGRLRVVANVAVGYDNIDVDAARRVGVAVCTTPDVLTETTADVAFLLILGAPRLAQDAEAQLRTGNWIGFGISSNLGRDVTARCWGCWVTAASRGRSPGGPAGSAWRSCTTPGTTPVCPATWQTSTTW